MAMHLVLSRQADGAHPGRLALAEGEGMSLLELRAVSSTDDPDEFVAILRVLIDGGEAPGLCSDGRRGTDMEPAQRDLHWQPIDIGERELLFDQIDAFLASRSRARTDEEAREADRCPDCGNPTMQRHYRYGPSGTVCCPNCGWEEVPF